MMTKQQLHKFIKDTKGLVRGASPQKKLKLLKLLKKAKRHFDAEELKKMDLDHEKIGSALDSKYGTASLVGALKEAGAEIESQDEQEVSFTENTDYIEEK
jgi:hypothetical protein